jgi:hypothetical protein
MVSGRVMRILDEFDPRDPDCAPAGACAEPGLGAQGQDVRDRPAGDAGAGRRGARGGRVDLLLHTWHQGRKLYALVKAAVETRSTRRPGRRAVRTLPHG